MAIDWELLDGSPMPKDAYKRLIEAMLTNRVDLGILNANGYAIGRSFPPYLSDIRAMGSSAASHMWNRNLPFQHLVGLKDPNGDRSPLALKDAYDRATTQIMSANIQYIIALERAKETVEIDEAPFIPDRRLSANARMRMFGVTNMSQIHRENQDEFTMLIPFWASTIFTWFATQGISWSLRPLLNMQGNDWQSIQSLSGLRGIQDPERYMSVSNQMSQNVFNTLHWATSLFRSYESPIHHMDDWREWHTNGMFAQAYWNGYRIGITPAGFTPPLVESWREKLCVFRSEP